MHGEGKAGATGESEIILDKRKHLRCPCRRSGFIHNWLLYIIGCTSHVQFDKKLPRNKTSAVHVVLPEGLWDPFSVPL